jgi:hypothetical protein
VNNIEIIIGLLLQFTSRAGCVPAAGTAGLGVSRVRADRLRAAARDA